VLRRAGYDTALIGKWHLTRDTGHGRDWDHSVVWHQGDFQGDVYNDQLLSIDGAVKRIVPGYSTDLYTRFAVDYIKKDHQKPWLLWLCYNAPHLPNTVVPRHKDRYVDVPVPIPADVFGPRPGKPRHMRARTDWRSGTGINEGKPMYGVFAGTDKDGKVQVDSQPLPQIVRDYNRLVCALDEGVGRLLKTLEETGQLQNTLIVFTSDQGFAWGEHGFAWKVAPYDACLRVPLLIRLPGPVARGEVCRHPVTVVDLPPTLLGLAGVPLPWTMHGYDLRPILKDPRAKWVHPALMEHFRSAFGSQTNRIVTEEAPRGDVRFPWWIFLCQGKYKYIRTLVPDEIEELYDLEEDPEELKNLALDKAHEELLAGYRQRMLQELRRIGAGLIGALPTIRRAP
jgi:arylsulfatase A-like enzyme